MRKKRTSASALSVEHAVLGRAFRETRAGQIMTQEGVAYRSGLHRNYVGAVERGEVNLTFRSMLAVARGLSVPLSTVIVLYEQRVDERAGRRRVGRAHD